MIKPGYRTSEFWFTVVSFIFSGLYLTGIIGENSQKENLIEETSRGLEAVILIAGQITVLYKYIKGRTDLKKTIVEQEETIEKTKPKPKGKKKNVKRKPTTTSRPIKKSSR